MSKKISPEERKLRTKELRRKHQAIFDSLGIPDAVFIPKMAFNEPSMDGKLVMGFFDGELANCHDIYTEMVSSEQIPEDPTRTLYKYRANPHFRTEYHNKPTAGGHDRFLVPVSELIEVKHIPSSKEKVATSKSQASTPRTLSSYPADQLVDGEDMPVGEMTVKDLAALLTGKPLSNKQWINDLAQEQKVKSTARKK
jgi:hypothetical protein